MAVRPLIDRGETEGSLLHGFCAYSCANKTRTDACSRQVMKILNLTPGDVVCFKSSFNRSNLRCATATRESRLLYTRPIGKLRAPLPFCAHVFIFGKGLRLVRHPWLYNALSADDYNCCRWHLGCCEMLFLDDEHTGADLQTELFAQKSRCKLFLEISTVVRGELCAGHVRVMCVIYTLYCLRTT